MANINSVTVTGNLTRDPELRETRSGSTVCSIRLAVNGRTKDGDGMWVDKPNYFDVAVFGKQGENCARFLSKGRPVAILGRLDWSEWETPEGQKRSAVKIVAQDVQFLGGRDDDGGASAPPAAMAAPAAAAAASAASSHDDIPF